MGQKRKQYSSKFKLQVVLELISGTKTTTQITSEYGVHVTQQVKWKRKFLEGAEDLFQDKRKKDVESVEDKKLIDQLYKKVGQLTHERDWLEKKIESLPGLFGKD